MKRKIFVISGLVILGLFLTFGLSFLKSSKSTPGVTHTVTLNESGFTPQNLSIKQGDLVTFRSTLPESFWPASDLHPTHGIYPEFDPQEPIEASSSSWQFTFDKKGAWKYHDHLNPFYRATIVVE